MVGLVRRRRIVGITTTIDRAPALNIREDDTNIERVRPIVELDDVAHGRNASLQHQTGVALKG